MEFTGSISDTSSGLYYMNARYYNPKTGRFLTQDAMGVDAWTNNLYSYCGNNPVNFKDPTGYFYYAINEHGVLEQVASPGGPSLPSNEVTISSSGGGTTPSSGGTTSESGRRVNGVREEDIPKIEELRNNSVFGIGTELDTYRELGALAGYPAAAYLLNHAWTGNGKNLIIGPNDPVGDALLKNDYFKNTTLDAFKSGNSIKINDIEYTYNKVSLSFYNRGSKDLEYAIGSADGYVLGRGYKYMVCIEDTYNFDEWRDGKSESDKLNNLGLACQYYGIIQAYDYSVILNINTNY